MRFILELLRIIILLLLVGGLLGFLEKSIYISLGLNVNNNPYMYLIGIANLILIFVVYRNKWQFSGWYKGQQKRKLPKQVTILLITIACTLLIITPFLPM